MKTLPTTLPGVVLIEVDVFGDHRGRFMETFRRDRYRDLGVGIGLEFVQDNYSRSAKQTLRGLHYQLAHPQGKLVHVTRGSVFDVAVDIRRGSPAFGQWFGTILSEENHRQLWIPPGFAHGFVVTSAEADFVYKVTATYDPTDERSIRWDDPSIAIQWPLEGEPLLSARDRAAPLLELAELPALTP
jgi:dTDP-4-dehydrorhamnose 3,5-epimerase